MFDSRVVVDQVEAVLQCKEVRDFISDRRRRAGRVEISRSRPSQRAVTNIAEGQVLHTHSLAVSTAVGEMSVPRVCNPSPSAIQIAS